MTLHILSEAIRHVLQNDRSGRNLRHSSRRKPSLESLETRKLLSITPINGTLTVHGDISGPGASDTIVLQENPTNSNLTQAWVNDQLLYEGPSNALTRVEILAGGGHDTVRIGNGNLDYLGSSSKYAIVVDGQDGVDKVIINDQTPAFHDTYTITSSTIQRFYFGGLTYSGIEDLTLNDQPGSNVIDINSTAFGVTLRINSSNGSGYESDTIYVGNGDLDRLEGAVVVDGRGRSKVIVNDQEAPYSDTYTITSSSLNRLSRPSWEDTFRRASPSRFGGLTYSGVVNDLTLNAQAGSNLINIDGATYKVTINGGRGDDQINNNLNSYSSYSVKIYGGPDKDVIVGGPGHDWLDGGEGDDSLDGGPGHDWLDGGPGHDRLDGGGDNDTLIGRDGNDQLYGGWGMDDLYGDNLYYNIIWGGIRYAPGEAEGSGNDTLFGGPDDDKLYGGGGDDKLFGESGFDNLFGMSGRDYLDGGNDGVADVLVGWYGADTFVAETYWTNNWIPKRKNRDEPQDYSYWLEGDRMA